MELDLNVNIRRNKRILSSKLLLIKFNPKLEITAAADAFNHGIEVVINHCFSDDKEKSITSRVRSATKRKCSQIEKEGLAVVVSVKEFHKIICGCRSTLVVYNKPLLYMFG